MTTKITFTAKPIAAIPDGWEQDWTVVMRVPFREWPKMKYIESLRDKKVGVEVKHDKTD